MVDVYPVVDEFGPGSCTCNGAMTGCCVCSVAAILLRFGKPIPRLADGTPNMRSLGASMGARHRAVADVNHGISLLGRCTPPNSGTNWCSYCGFLELKARGVPVSYGPLTDSQIIGILRAKRPILVAGIYGTVPVVSESSYSKSVPARGRSDTGFTGSHMVVAFDIRFWSNGSPRSVIISDPDFGSPSRPVVPPHSEWSWATFLAYIHSVRWNFTFALKAPPALTTPTPTPTPTTAKYRAVVRTSSGQYFQYHLEADGDIKPQPYGRTTHSTGGFSGLCSAPSTHRWPTESRSVSLVKIQDSRSAYNGIWIPASYAERIS